MSLRSSSRAVLLVSCVACGGGGAGEGSATDSTGGTDGTSGTSGVGSSGEPTGGLADYEELWPGPGSAFAVVADDIDVFWTVVDGDRTKVMRFEKASASVSEVASVPGTEGNPTAGIAVDASNVYWVTRMGADDDLWQAPRGGGTALAIGQSGSSGYPVHSDGARVYWRAQGLVAVPVGGGEATTIAEDCASFAIADDVAFCATDSGITSVPLAGGPPTPVLGDVAAGSLLVDATTVYMRGATWIRSVPRTGGAAEELWSGGSTFVYAQFGFVADEASVYFLQFSAVQGATPVRLDKQGGPAAPLGSPRLDLVGVAVDDSHVYVTTAMGALLRAPK